MDKEKLLLELNNQIETIKAHISRLKRNERNIHVLDVDMLRNKTIELYEMVSKLEQLVQLNPEIGADKPHKVVRPKTETKVVEPPVINEAVDEVEGETIEDIIETLPAAQKPEIIENDVTIEETASPKYVKPIIEETTVVEPELQSIKTIPEVEQKPQKPQAADVVENEITEPVVPEKPQTPQTTYDLFSGNTENVVAEKYHAKEEQSIADKMQKSQISNIREAIGINEKFLFINELFNGDLGKYNKILDDVNNLPTKQGVDTYLFELKIQFQWADDNGAFIKLKELLDRKFV